jgi:hypothetical protein
MNNHATKNDINEAIDIVKIFMNQVLNKFDEMEKRFDALDVKYDHLINSVDSILTKQIGFRLFSIKNIKNYSQ